MADNGRYLLTIIFAIISILIDVFLARGYAATGFLFCYSLSYFSNNKNTNLRWRILLIGVICIICMTILGYVMSAITKNEWSKVDGACLENLSLPKKAFLEANKKCMNIVVRNSVLFYDFKQANLVYLVFPYTRVYVKIPSMQSKEIFD